MSRPQGSRLKSDAPSGSGSVVPGGSDAPKAGRRKWLFVILIAICLLIGFALLLVFTFVVPGLTHAGTWEDDPKNWRRAFDQEPSSGVKIVHSWYCRTPHFTYECQFFFELAANDGLRKSASDSNGPQGVTPLTNHPRGANELQTALSQKPMWFAPKGVGAYEIYEGKPPHETYFVLIDRGDGSIFLTDRSGM